MTPVMETGIPKLGFEEPIQPRGGEQFWVLTSKVPLRNADGRVQGLVGIYANISDRRRQETALQEAKRVIEKHAAHLEEQVREAHERTRQLLEKSGEAVFVLDAAGSVLEVNPVAERLLGVSQARLMGTSFEALAPEDERETLRQALEALRARGTVCLEEQGLRSASGGRVVLGIAASLQVTGEARRLLVVGTDLTEKRRLEQQSIQNDRLASMGALAAGIAHEINNPTSYVLSNLSWLKEWSHELEQTLAGVPGLPPSLGESLAEVKEVLAESLVGGGRIRDIVRDMRSSRIPRARPGARGHPRVPGRGAAHGPQRAEAHGAGGEAVRGRAAARARQRGPAQPGLPQPDRQRRPCHALWRAGAQRAPGRHRAGGRAGAHRHRGHGPRDSARGALAHLRALLHHQAGRLGHGAGPVHQPVHHPEDGRRHAGEERARPGHHLLALPPGEWPGPGRRRARPSLQ